MKRNISKFKYCYGCSVCVISCPQKIIQMRINDNGFYQPFIVNESSCINCGLCLKSCSFEKSILQQTNKTKSYAAWSLDSDTRYASSSGGVGYELAKTLFSDGYKFIGVRYNEVEQRAEHFVGDSIDDINKSRGSKYLQSYFLPALLKVKKGEKFFVTGTPCQIASVRNYIKKNGIENDFVLMDFFCHGVPSYLLWYKYLDILKSKVKKINTIIWRCKKDGWHDSWAIGVNVSNGLSSKNEKLTEDAFFEKRSKGNLFYKFFLGNLCLNKPCYSKCKFKAVDSSADIRIGDFWGDSYAANEEGVSACLVFTERGLNALNKANVYKKEVTVENVLEGQIKHMIKQPYFYALLIKILKTRINLVLVYKLTQVLRIFTILKSKLHSK